MKLSQIENNNETVENPEKIEKLFTPQRESVLSNSQNEIQLKKNFMFEFNLNNKLDVKNTSLNNRSLLFNKNSINQKSISSNPSVTTNSFFEIIPTVTQSRLEIENNGFSLKGSLMSDKDKTEEKNEIYQKILEEEEKLISEEKEELESLKDKSEDEFEDVNVNSPFTKSIPHKIPLAMDVKKDYKLASFEIENLNQSEKKEEMVKTIKSPYSMQEKELTDIHIKCESKLKSVEETKSFDRKKGKFIFLPFPRCVEYYLQRQKHTLNPVEGSNLSQRF